MSTSYPGALDSFVNPTATDTLDSATVPHAAQHDNINDAMAAVQVTLGVNPQGGSATVVARLTAIESSVSGKASLSAANTFTTGAQTIRTGADATKALILQRNSASQSANILSVVQSDGTTELARVRPVGQLGVGTLITNTALGINTDLVGDNRAIVIKAGQTTPTNNAIELLPLANNTPVMKVDFAGNITAPTFIGALTGNASTATSATSATTAGNLSGTQTAKFVYAAPNGADGTASFRALLASDIPTLNQDTTGNAGTVTNGVYKNAANTFTTGTQVIATGADGTVGLKVQRNSATQSADIVQVTQSDGTTVLAKIAANGAITTASGLTASGAITTSGNISTTGGGSITSATNVTAAGFVATGTTNVTLGTSGSTGGNIVFATTGGTQSLIAGTGATGSQTLPSTAGTLLNNATTSTTGLTSASNLATVGTITSGTWNATAIDISKGGTGTQYGSILVGHSQLNADVTKNANDTTPESVFRTGTAFSSIQYFNVDANTTYFFEGTIRLLKTTTSSTVNNSMIYYATGGTTPLTEQSAFISTSSFSTTATLGFGSATATASAATSSASTGTSVVTVFRGHITTHASTAGRFNIASWLTSAGASAPQFLAGSYINLYKVGTGSVQTVGSWA